MRAAQDDDTVQLKVRIKESVRSQIERDARSRGISSLNKAISERLEASLETERIPTGPRTAVILEALAIIARGNDRWLDDYRDFHSVMTLWRRQIDVIAPPPMSQEVKNDVETIRRQIDLVYRQLNLRPDDVPSENLETALRAAQLMISSATLDPQTRKELDDLLADAKRKTAARGGSAAKRRGAN
jgi:hypothetical protein